MIKVTVNTLLLATTVLAGRCAVPVNGHLGDADCVGAGTIRYDHWTASGSYDRVTNMDIATGQCSTEPQSYSGGMAPLNEEVSMHFRGPLHLKQFAFYLPGSSSYDYVVDSFHVNKADRPHKHEWIRAGYYDAERQVSTGLTFLNKLGGSASGVFDTTFGLSLSYASSSGREAASGPEILANEALPSSTEIVIMSDRHCKGNSCGYHRPGTVAYHGFDGDEKVFLAELSMPLDGNTSSPYGNTPSWWMLNAEIPRTVQYPTHPNCNCHDSGCGELDIMEVTWTGNTHCTSTLHTKTGVGATGYIERPTGAPVKVALIMSKSTATIQVLPASFNISRTLTDAQVHRIASHGVDQEAI